MYVIAKLCFKWCHCNPDALASSCSTGAGTKKYAVNRCRIPQLPVQWISLHNEKRLAQWRDSKILGEAFFTGY